MRERIIERKAKARFEKEGWIHLKFTPMGSNGWPDQIVITPSGVVGFAEMKRPGLDLEPLQKIRQRLLRQFGIVCEKVDNETSLNYFIDKIKKESGCDL